MCRLIFFYLKSYINLVQYICERRNSQPVGCTRGRAQRQVPSRILSYQLVNARESQIVVDRNTSQQIMLFFLSTSTPISTIGKHDKMRLVALCYDVIRSDAMVPIVEAIVLIGINFWQPKKFPRSTRSSRLTSGHDKI